jgi:peptide/nickel transport system substrate-binding protein
MRSIKSRWLAPISALAVALSCAVAVAATKTPRYGGTLRVELSVTSISLDPRAWKPGSVAAADYEKIASLLFDRLLTLDDYGRFQPALAIEWSHDANARNWQFKLRPGVKFSDGTPLTSKEAASALQPLLPQGLQISATENGLQIRAAHPTPDLLEQVLGLGVDAHLPEMSLDGFPSAFGGDAHGLVVIADRSA